MTTPRTPREPNSLAARLSKRVTPTRTERKRRQGEHGDTLIEVLLALMVLGLTSVALLTAFGTSISSSAEHRSLVIYNTLLTNASEQAISQIQSLPTDFTVCHPLSYYQNTANVDLTIPPPYANNYTAEVTDVLWLNPATMQFTSTCVVGEPQQITVTVSDSANTTSYANTFNVTSSISSATLASGIANQLVFTTEPGGGTPGLAMPTQPVVEIEDSGGNAVTTDLSPVTLSLSTPGGATLTSCQGTESLGVVTFAGCSVSAAGTYTLTANDNSLTSAISTSFTISGTANQLVFTQSPAIGASGSAFSTQPIVKIETSNGTIVTGSTATISLSASGGALSGCTNLTAVAGIVNVHTCAFAGTIGAYYTLTASASGMISGSSSTFTPSTFGTASQMLFTTEPSGVASASDTAAFTAQPGVTIEDSAGNVVTNYATSVKLTMTGGGTLSCTPTSNSATPSGGVAQFSGCHASSYANGVTITASSTGLTSITSTPFNITGIASKLVFSTQPVAGASGTAFTTQPVVTVEDSNGNTVTSSVGSINITASGGTLTYCAGLVPTNGVISPASCTFTGLVGTSYTLSAAESGLTSATSSSFTPTTFGQPTRLVYTTSPVGGVAGSTLSVQPVIKIEDAAGNVITTSYATITLSASGGSLANCASLGAVAGVVDVTSCTFGGLITGNYTLTATTGTLSSATATFAPTSPGPAATIASSTGASQSAAVLTSYASPLTALVTDTYGNPVPGASVVFSTPLSGASATFAGNVTSETSNSSGIVTSASFTSNTVAGTYVVTATMAAGSSTTFAETSTAKTTNDTMTVTGGNTQSAIVGAGFTNPLGVNITDQYGNSVSGMNVSFTAPSSGASATFATGCTSNPNTYTCVVTTNASGNATSSVASGGHTVGNYSVSATASGVSAPATFALSNTVGSPATLAATSGSGQSATVGSGFTNPLVATVTDQYGNVVSGATVTFTVPSSGASATSSIYTATTNSSGVATSSTFSAGHVSGSYTITATSGTGSATYSMTNHAGSAGTLTFTNVSAESATVGTAYATPLSVTATDQYGNVVSGATVTYAVPGSGPSATASTYTATTNSSGVATSATFTANHIAGSYYLVSATTPGATAISFALTNTAGAPTTLTATSGSGQTATVGSGFTNPLVATVTDQYGNPVSGATVTFTVPGSGPTDSSALFNGSSGDVVGPLSSTATASTSMVAWVNGTGATHGALAFLGNTARGYGIGIGGTTWDNAGTNVIALYQNVRWIPTTTQLNPGWNMLVLTLSATGTPTIYLNGSAIYTDSSTGPLSPSGGNTYVGTDGTGSRFVGGNVAQTAFFTSTLSASQISALYSAGTTSTSSYNSSVSSLSPVTWWTLNDTAGSTTATDSSGNGHTGTVSSGVTLGTADIAGGAGATASAYTVTTNSAGVVTSPAFSANSVAGNYTITATSGTGSATFAMTNHAGGATGVTITPSPTTTTVSNLTNVTLTLQLVDSYGNPTTASTATSVTLTSSSTKDFYYTALGHSGTLNAGTTVSIPANGTGSVLAYYGDESSGTPTITATVNGSTWGTTSALTMTAGSAATVTATSGSGHYAVTNHTFANPLVVTVTDAYGNLVSGVTVTFNAPNQSGASVTFAGGANTATTNSSGVATSAQMTANAHTGNNYTITASSAGATSANFTESNES
jgi:type II secretory pathway pseudopilin PulG